LNCRGPGKVSVPERDAGDTEGLADCGDCSHESGVVVNESHLEPLELGRATIHRLAAIVRKRERKLVESGISAELG
jgi:hypothetical protein